MRELPTFKWWKVGLLSAILWILLWLFATVRNQEETGEEKEKETV